MVNRNASKAHEQHQNGTYLDSNKQIVMHIRRMCMSMSVKKWDSDKQMTKILRHLSLLCGRVDDFDPFFIPHPLYCALCIFLLF